MKALSESFPELAAVAEAWDQVQVTIIETRTSGHPFAWRPAVNAFRCAAHFVVFADLAGIPPEAIAVSATPRQLMIRGTRPAPEPGRTPSDRCQLLALEIDHGAFERVLELPHEVDPADLATEYRGGLLRIQLPLKA